MCCAPDPERLVTRVRRLTRDEDTVAFAAETLAEQLFGATCRRTCC